MKYFFGTKGWVLFLVACCLTACGLQQQEQHFDHIRQLTALAETYFKNEPVRMANVYAPDAILAGPNDEIAGQAAIQAYWKKMSNPIELDILTEKLTTEIDSVALPARWRRHLESSEADLVFQQGVFKMEYEDEDVTHQRKMTPFTWVWAKQPKGYWRVAVEVRRRH